MKKIINWLIDKWLASFLTTSFFFLLKAYIDLPDNSKEKIWEFQWLLEIINTKYELWFLIIIIALIIILTQIEKKLAKNNANHNSLKKEPFIKPEFLKYTTDEFGINKSIWVWEYKWDNFNEFYNIENITPICPECKNPMLLNNTSTFYVKSATCPKCRLEGKRHQYQLQENIDDIGVEISRRIDNRIVAK